MEHNTMPEQNMHRLRFRQVHLDFHTAPQIGPIGLAFDKSEWQAMLTTGHVNSITCFAKCHHGWSYHPTTVGQQHPHLTFDLLRAQYDACKELDINVPIYLSAGYDNMISQSHPEWREIDHEGKFFGAGIMRPGFHPMCFNSPYVDYLCDQIHEVVQQFPEADGIFLDIISQRPCCCTFCLAVMARHGLNPAAEADREACAALALKRYYDLTTAAVQADRPDRPVFHNYGNIERGRRDLLAYNTHLELESLPTGGWGYDHFPVSAKYSAGVDMDFLGMTGKFHTSWGEFGGFKHPNALRYECAAMLACGAKCSVGDQLHPNGKLDRSTYRLIGAAYAEVEAKEPWCDRVRAVADIGLLSSSAAHARGGRASDADDGAARVLLEGGYLFDVLDLEMSFAPYRMLVLPDDIPMSKTLASKLNAYLADGGKLFLTGSSGLRDDATCAFDIGATTQGLSALRPDYVLPCDRLRPDWIDTPLVMYLPSQRLTVTDGESLGVVYDPYFNRTWDHFCSHQHTPHRPEPTGYACGVRKGPILYLAHPVFTIYKALGAVSYRAYIANALDLLLGAEKRLTTSLPSAARVSLMHQPDARRYILHLLYACPATRGSQMTLSGGATPTHTRPVEVIEDLPSLRDIAVSLTPPEPIDRVTLEPQGRELDYTVAGAEIRFTVPHLCCHQMVVLHAAAG
jgi:hypothetical protein